MSFATTWMDLQIIIISKVSQTEKANVILYLLYMDLKYKTQTKVITSQKQTQSFREWTYGYQRDSWGQGQTGNLGLTDTRCCT